MELNEFPLFNIVAHILQALNSAIKRKINPITVRVLFNNFFNLIIKFLTKLIISKLNNIKNSYTSSINI